MTGDLLAEKIEKLESVFLNILYLKPEERVVSPNMSTLGDLKSVLNQIFNENICVDVSYTLNTDKPFFGIHINPAMSPSDAVVILSTDERVKLNKYQIEFDSKLFDIGLNDSELAALTIHEISSMMDSFEVFDKVRECIDGSVVSSDDIISIRDSVNYAQLIIFAIKDTMYKVSSFMFKSDEDISSNPAIMACDFEEYVISAKNKISSSVSGMGDTMRTPSPAILQWMFVMYKDMKINSKVVADTLTDAKAFTGSKLEIAEIDKCLYAVDRIDGSILLRESADLNTFFTQNNMGSLNEISLFRNLKKNGLRSIEDELYEFTMRVKNCTEANDAYLILRGINSRLSILEDYLDLEDLKDSERKHWTAVSDKYKDLRIQLAKKKFKEPKSYGLFYDYDQLPSDKDNKTSAEISEY